MYDFKELASQYWHSVRVLIIDPAQFFSLSDPLPGYNMELVFAFPPVLILSVASVVLQQSILALVGCLLGVYAGIGLWAVVSRFVLLALGVNRTFKETLHISAAASICCLLSLIPLAGGLLSALYFGFLCWKAYTHRFKMDPAQALVAVSLPIVVGGFSAGILAFFFAGLSTVHTLMK